MYFFHTIEHFLTKFIIIAVNFDRVRTHVVKALSG